MHKIIVLTAFIFSLTSCAIPMENMETGINNNVYELPQNCDFNNVVNNSELKSDCSPKLIDQFPKSNFQGILINGAPEIVWPKNVGLKNMSVLPNGNAQGPLKFMIAGLVNFPYNTLDLKGNFAYQVVIVAVNQKTAKVYNGKMIPFGFAGIKPNTLGYQVPQTNTDTISYFNIDLVQNLEIPIENATYNIYATLGEYKSNILTVTTNVK